MGMYINNGAMGCPYCGHYIKEGVESQQSLGNKIIVECKWHCDRCGMVARRDERIIDKNEAK
jgi:C4-type Zn-finger protein